MIAAGRALHDAQVYLSLTQFRQTHFSLGLEKAGKYDRGAVTGPEGPTHRAMRHAKKEKL